jgi:hypothetical protein
VVSFLNGMLQYNSENRLTSEELAMHPFLTKRIKEFTKIDTKRASKKIDNRGLNINVKANQTIWAIFNEEDEKKLVNIKGGRDMPAPEGPISEDYNVRNKRAQTEKHIPRMKINNNNNINQQNNRNIPNNNNNQYNNINNNNQIKNYPTFDNSFYGHNMYPNFNIILNQQGGKQPEMYQNPGVQQQRIQQIPGSYQISRQQMAGMGYTSNMSNYQGFGVPMAYSYGGMYQNSNIRVPYPPGYMPNKANNYPKQYSFYNDLDEDDRNLGCCII